MEILFQRVKRPESARPYLASNFTLRKRKIADIETSGEKRVLPLLSTKKSHSPPIADSPRSRPSRFVSFDASLERRSLRAVRDISEIWRTNQAVGRKSSIRAGGTVVAGPWSQVYPLNSSVSSNSRSCTPNGQSTYRNVVFTNRGPASYAPRPLPSPAHSKQWLAQACRRECATAENPHTSPAAPAYWPPA